MTTIGVISDTHGLLRPEVEHCFAGVAHIIHAGDIGAEHVLEGLRRIAPVTAIRGNVDSGDLARNYRETETVRLGRYVFYVLHDLNELESKPAPDGIDAVIYGHSHRASVRTADGVLYLNPGSAGPRRFKLPITLATLDLDESTELRPVLHTLGGA
ncbi:metallophosphoesterase family protein [Bradyrhizobium sp. CCBAU 45389]|uniref:metallophosphoesterase family protein n=1 Tax=Bradyrhizobium sp. CCBAU 45389 TaxID=858429 RepID=UPI002305C7D5|nr:metallophosphoesterase family protein [Bradyrhizobium sp. CCBAU 45389]MDA9403633.1 phosphodiesterase [Bradyrhizobium sp. CCBAU 45389]